MLHFSFLCYSLTPTRAQCGTRLPLLFCFFSFWAADSCALCLLVAALMLVFVLFLVLVLCIPVGRNKWNPAPSFELQRHGSGKAFWKSGKKWKWSGTCDKPQFNLLYMLVPSPVCLFFWYSCFAIRHAVHILHAFAFCCHSTLLHIASMPSGIALSRRRCAGSLP
jgi:hypothetical protein